MSAVPVRGAAAGSAELSTQMTAARESGARVLRPESGVTREPPSTRWLFAAYLALIVWVPVPLGSNRAWSWAVLEIWVLLIALGWLFGYVRERHEPGIVLRKSWPMLVCLAAWLLYVWLQLIPMPLGLLQMLSPDAARWHSAAALGSLPSMAPLTLDRYGTLEAALKSTAYAAFFAISLALVSSRDRVRLATYAVILSGIGQSLYGMFTSFQNLNGWATGTFVNRNHFAAYLVMCLSVGIGVLVASLSGDTSHSWRERVRGMVEWLITPKMALRLLLVAMVIALVMSRSRMGNIAFLASLFSTGAISLALSRKATRSIVVLLVSLVVIDIFIVGTYFGAEKVVERIGQTARETEDRVDVAGYALRMWKDYPVFGSGLGSFPSVFPRYSAQGTALSYTHAHNDYLEFGAETGVLGLALLGLMVSMSFAAALRAQQTRRDPVMRGISFASMMAIIALMVHAFAEFNFQIPANALTFMLMLAFGWIARYAGGPGSYAGEGSR